MRTITERRIITRTIMSILSIILVLPAFARTTPAGRLKARLAKIEKAGIMFGHHDDTFYGHNWHGVEGRSDVLETAGDYPAVMEFELSGYESGRDKNIDGVPFKDIVREIVKHYQRGGVVAIDWHCPNLILGKTAWDHEGDETARFLDGDSQSKLDSAIARVASFMASLKTEKGVIPVIFRPWHEMNGDWFWWGGKNTTPDLYRRLYRRTYDIVQKQCRGQIVWAFCANLGAKSMDEYYPGDKYVDIVGIDIYDFNNDAKAFADNTDKGLDMVCRFAKAHHKLAAMTETGCQQLPQTNWFTETLWPVISRYPISYVLLWRNAWDNPKELYTPYKGHPTEPDFKRFVAEPRTLFVNDIKNIK